MSRLPRGLILAAALCVVAHAACTDITGATRELLLVPERTRLTAGELNFQGFPATFINHSASPVQPQGWGCDAIGAFVDRRAHFVWVELGPIALPLESVVASCRYNPAGPAVVASGDSLRVYGWAGEPGPGTYRLRFKTSGGVAISNAIIVQ